MWSQHTPKQISKKFDKYLRMAKESASTVNPTPQTLAFVSVYSGSPTLCARALSRLKVDGCVPEIQHVNLRIVCLRMAKESFSTVDFLPLFRVSGFGITRVPHLQQNTPPHQS